MQPMFAKRYNWTRSLFGIFLIIYILFFSGFALYHAYSENELIDSHGCPIGIYVQHGDVAFAVLITSVIFWIRLIRFCSKDYFPDLYSYLNITTRGPPAFSLV